MDLKQFAIFDCAKSYFVLTKNTNHELSEDSCSSNNGNK